MTNILLNIKTHYELLSSLIKIEDLIKYALKNNINVLGVTDSNLFSFMEFYNLCKNNNIKPIVGIDLKIDDKKNILYARNYKGYQNLCRIVSEKNLNELNIDVLKKYSSDLICVCDKNNYLEFKDIYEFTFIRYENKNELDSALEVTKDVVYMNEVLCFTENDYKYLKYLYMIKDGKTVNDEINYNFKNNHINLNISEFDLNTNKVFSDLINVELPKYEVRLPKYTSNSLTYLKELCNKGLNKRLNNNIPESYKERLNYELSIIEKTGFVDYFLIVYDIILYAKKNNIFVGPGRGSAVSSLVSYSLGIIDIDPLKYDLLFERFLNPARVSMPDIDIDISDIKRDEVIDYVKSKYGSDSVASIITFSTMQPKQVLRDVGKVLNINSNKLDKLLSLLNDNDSLEDLKNNNKYKDLIKFNKEYIELVDISCKLENLKKHPSVHAAGIVIDSEVLTNKVPLFKSGNNVIVGYDKHYIESLGILKIDLLSLRNLSIIEEILNDIKLETGKYINFNNIPLNEEKTFEIFRKGNTTGIFQFESSGMTNLIKKFNVNKFDDLVIAVAMFRPGPISMIPAYLDRRNGKEKVTYPAKELESILSETLGIMIYQEQLLQILRLMAGYTYSEADVIRSAIKNKDESILVKEKENFIEKSLELGYKKETIISVYNMIMKFANYGFNKSHSVAYAFIAYGMAYLKANYPHIFMMNLLNKEISRSNKIKEYIDESKSLGLEFDTISINLSTNMYYKNNDKIVMPFNAIKGINDNISNLIIEQRNKNKFTGFIDFVCKCYSKTINKKVLESLILIGAFDEFNINRRTLIENLESIINYSLLKKELGEYDVLPELNNFDEYSNEYLLEIEFELLGFYFLDHPVTKYRKESNISTKNIKDYFDKNIIVYMLIESIREIKTSKGDNMAFVRLSDEYGNIEGIIFPTYYSKIKNDLKKSAVKLYCKVERRYSDYQLIINEIEFLK